MANQTRGFGLRPIGKVGQNRDAQGQSEYRIAASATAIYFQDPVKALNTGTIGVAAAGDQLLGSLNGVFFTNTTTRKPTWTNNLQASNTATDILGYVADDPYERFEIKSNDSNASAQTDVFLNANIVYAAGDSANYVSAVRLDNATINTTNTLQLRIIGPSTNIGNDDLGSAGVTWVVNINNHFYKQTTGV
jgi:hypothetical protein